jgi:hypothetical protein
MTTQSNTLLAPTPRLLYSRKGAAYQLSISARSLDYLIASGDLRPRRKGGRVLLPYSELVRFAEGDRKAPLVPEPRK